MSKIFDSYKSFAFFCFTIAIFLVGPASQAVEYKFEDSAVLGLWSFAIGAASSSNGTPAAIEYYQKSKFRSAKIDNDLQRLGELIEINFQGNFDFTNAVTGRDEQSWNINKHFLVEAALAKNLSDFERHTSDFLPIIIHRELFQILRNLEPLYQNLIWAPSIFAQKRTKKQLNESIQLLKKEELLIGFINFIKRRWMKKKSFRFT